MAAQLPTTTGRGPLQAPAGAGKSFWARYRLPYLYILPASIILLIITIYPIAYGLYLSFTDFRLRDLRDREANWVWFDNYERILTNRLPLPNFDFWRILGFNITWTITNVVFHVIIGLAVALLLNRRRILFRSQVEFLTWLQNFGGANAKPGLFQQNDDAAVSSLFKEGKAAMVINGPWALGDYEGALGEGKVGVAPLPLISEKGDAPPKPFLGVKHIMMSNNIEGDQAALAFEFMKFFTGPESAGPLAEAAGHLPADTTVDVSADPIAQAFIEQGENVTPMPSIPEMGQVWEPAGQMITTVLSGDATPEEAAATAQDTINSAIENMA